MNKKIALIICMFLIIPILIPISAETKFFECYRVNAPFGIVWVEIRGSMVLTFGHLHSDLGEAYIVKYYVNDEIHTLILDAEKTPVIIDGTFRLERVNSESSAEYFDYKIHIPISPILNQTITTEWTFK